MYFITEQEKKHGKVDLLVSKPGSANFMEADIHSALSDSDTVLHVAYSWLIKDMKEMQAIRTVIASFVIADRKSFGATSILPYNVVPDYDVSNRVHLVYVKKILGAKTPADIDRLYCNEQDTRIIRGLFYERWLFVERMLSDLRRERTKLRRSNPRSSGEKRANDEDMIDRAISHMTKKVNAVMNHILFCGDKRIFSLSEK